MDAQLSERFAAERKARQDMKVHYVDARKAYLDGFLTHSQFYDWLLSISGRSGYLKDYVGRRIGVNQIKQSQCEHFNDIPLKLWYDLDPVFRDAIGRKIGQWSLSDTVCCAKELARQIKEESEK